MRARSAPAWNRRRSPVFIQSFEQSNLQRLNRMIDVRLVQLVDANDVNPDGTLDYTAPFDRPYDWTVSGNPVLHEPHVRLLRHRRGPGRDPHVRGRHRPVEALHRQHRGGRQRRRRDRRRRERRRQRRRGRPRPAPADRPDPARARARAARPHVDVPQRAQAAGGGLPEHPGRGVPAVLRARHRRGVRRLPGHRADRAGAHGPAGGVGLRR